MKKLLLLSALLLAGMFSASAQYQRRVLVEEFTNASCPPCAGQNPGFNAILHDNLSKITPIKYQTNWPGYDPMNVQNAAHVATRVAYYGVTGVPNGFTDGVGITNDCNYYDNAPACLDASDIDALYTVTSPVNIVLTHSITADNDSILIDVTVTSDVAISGTIKLHVAVIEEEINFDAAPGTNGEMVFEQVMRRMLPNASGTTTGAFTVGQVKTYHLGWPINYAYDLNKLGAVAWLQNNTTKEVFNSARSEPVGGITGNGVKLNNTMATFICTPGVSPSFTLENTGATALTSAMLRYRVGGTGTFTDFPWTGNLAPGASELVTISSVVLANGNTKIEVKAAESNIGIQTNLIDVLTMNVKALLDAPVGVPTSNDFEDATVPPSGWSVTNVAANGWVAGAVGYASAGSAKNNFYDYSAGVTDLYTPKLDLSASAGITTLSFDYAYAYYTDANGSLYDSLAILVSADCGATWTNVFQDGGESLATADATGASYAPVDDAEWLNKEIDLSAYNGTPSLLVRFSGITGYGNNLYVDNVNLKTASSVKTLDLNSFTLAPNPAKDMAEVRFGLPTAQNIQMMIYNSLGSLVQSSDLGEMTSGQHTVTVNALHLSTGTYRVVLQGKDGIAQTQMVVLK